MASASYGHVDPESVAALSHHKGGSVDKAAASLQEEARNYYAMLCLLIRMQMRVAHGTELPHDIEFLMEQDGSNEAGTKGFKVVI